ncbi:MAG: L-ribulose-5-phosphate 4-epimerase [Firmicutes bacterium]|nr:L-ribulose-5-phosphate 4-epimerase [Candidatus Colivicinus equi]
MLEQLKQKVFEANLLLPKYHLVSFSWGNVSEITEDRKYVVIKPSGIPYENMKVEDMVVVDIDGNVVDGKMKPSSDLLTHLEIYRNFIDVKGICHTHSTFATSWAQALKDIPALGTTHADTFYGDVPCTRLMNKAEIENDYELNTGKVIVETFDKRNIDPIQIPGVIVASHGPFTWGKDSIEAVENSVMLEEISKMDFISTNIDKCKTMQQELLDKHYFRKHGKNAYYGQ